MALSAVNELMHLDFETLEEPFKCSTTLERICLSLNTVELCFGGGACRALYASCMAILYERAHGRTVTRFRCDCLLAQAVTLEKEDEGCIPLAEGLKSTSSIHSICLAGARL
eukprot:6195216-Pleurochrysis_carterae.AAC.1